MQLSADEISQIIKSQIQNFDSATLVKETGTVLSTGDGIARLYGLEGAMAGELVQFSNSVYGLVLNLEDDNVGVALLGDVASIKEGDSVKRTGTIASVTPVSCVTHHGTSESQNRSTLPHCCASPPV